MFQTRATARKVPTCGTVRSIADYVLVMKRRDEQMVVNLCAALALAVDSARRDILDPWTPSPGRFRIATRSEAGIGKGCLNACRVVSTPPTLRGREEQPVSDIHREFERHLTGWQRRYRDRPQRELVCLYLLALEREENVAVAYSEPLLGPRLAALPVAVGVREVMRAVLRRVWEDEEEHVVYVRAALDALDMPLLHARALLQQTAGMLGGWTVAVRQHQRWAEAPLSRAAATLLLWAGGVSGRVPRAVRRHLDYCSFRDFCIYNVHTEGTAWRCWQRLTELAERVPALCGEHLKDFRRIAADEDRHRRMFETIGDALDGGDRLRADVTPQQLAARLELAA